MINENGIDYEEFVTKAELSEWLRQNLRIEGDEQSIAIDQTPTGWVVRSLQPLAGSNESETTEIFTSSYDSSADTYTISWDSFFMWCNYFGDVQVSSDSRRHWAQKEVPAGSLTFNAQILTALDKIYLQPMLEVTSSPYLVGSKIDIKWGGILTGSDSDTQNAEMEDPEDRKGRIGSNICVLSTGSVSEKAAMVIDWRNDVIPVAEFGYTYDTQTTRISMPVNSQGASGGRAVFFNKILGNSFDDDLIIGWDNFPVNETFDALANAASYVDYEVVGYAKTDASGNLVAAVKWSDHINRPFGPQGSFANPDGSGFVYYEHGLIRRVTT